MAREWEREREARHAARAAEPAVYEIKVKGRLGGHWARRFDGMTVTVEEHGVTVLRGPVADQAALYGLLSRLRDLALPLLSVNLVGETGD